jgi:isopentenyl-diphosphate delta-isomerase
VEHAAARRLVEEMGLVAEPRHVGTFLYRADDATTGLVERELDHVLVARCDDDPVLNADEADDWRLVTREKLDDQLRRQPHQFTPWFPLVLQTTNRWLDAPGE